MPKYNAKNISAQNVHILNQTLGKMGHRISHFRFYFRKIKTVFMFRRWPFLLTFKEFLKNPNPSQSYSHFSKLWPSKPPQRSARARRVMLAKIQIGYFGYY